MLSRKPRSWHPSPYGSDEEPLDEEDLFNREVIRLVPKEMVRPT